MECIELAERLPANMSEDIFTQFSPEVDEICPPLGKEAVAKDHCFEATVSNLSASKKDRDEYGVDQEECPEAGGPGGMVVMRTMRRIEEMQKGIGSLVRRQKHPKPILWPMYHSQA
jgi:hypothetical protein